MNKTSLRFQQILSALLVVAAIGLLGWLSTQYKHEFDLTAGQRNSLTAASLRQLKQMKGPVEVLAFAPTGADSRAEINQFFNRYQLVKKDFKVTYIDPIKNPAKVREYNIAAAGDMVLQYDGRQERLAPEQMNEANVTQALQRLSYAEERFVVFLTGHGEHGLDDRGAAGYSGLAEILKDSGLKAIPLNLASSPKVPENAGVLVVAGPRTALMEGETQILLDYLKKGGNILWLADPDSAPPPDALVKALGFAFDAGTAVFPEFAAMGGDPSQFIALGYPDTVVTRDLAENTLFPLMNSISADPASTASPAWAPQPFLQSTQDAWLETGPLSGEVAPDEAQGDKPGPLTLGLMLTRPTKPEAAATPDNPNPPKSPQQRAALVGDSDWLANAVLGQAGNSKLAVNLLRWLVSRDEQLGIDIPKVPDASLDLSPTAATAIALGFLVLLPLTLLLIGVIRWLIRRRR